MSGNISYVIRVNKGPDGMWEATVDELPDVADYGPSLDEAIELLVDTILTTEDAFDEEDE